MFLCEDACKSVFEPIIAELSVGAMYSNLSELI